MISYEISIGLVIIGIMYGTSYNIIEIYNNNSKISGYIINYVSIIMYITIIIAELGRVPFDIVEAESEITAGPYTEYSGIPFALYFLVEYGSLLFHSILLNTLFFTRLTINLASSVYIQLFISSIITVLILLLFIVIRATLPRVKWDQLITINWLNILPGSILYLFVIIIFTLLL